MHFDLFHELAMPPQLGRSETQAVADWLCELELADTLGFRCAWLPEHHFSGDYSHCAAPDLLLAAASTRTRRLRLGLAVIPLPHHHPVRVAERVATLDVLSGGRLEVGIGRGFSPLEYAVFGADQKNSRAIMTEALALLRASFRREPVRLVSGETVNILPKPVQAAPPLWAAAVSPEGFAWAADQKLPVLAGPFKPWFMTRADLAAFRAAWPASTPPSIGLALGIFCLRDGRRARRLAAPAFEWFYRELFRVTAPVLERLYPGYEHFASLGRFRHLLRLGVNLRFLTTFGMAVVGSPEECVEALGKYREAGVTHLLCAVGAGALPTDLVRECLHVLAEEVMPHFAVGDGPDHAGSAHR